MSMYGGFEQVGSLGTSLPRNDVQTVTGQGDIVLYSGNRIVIFYGSNSWAYTYVGSYLENYDSLISLAHFKGHAMADYGGAIKNMSIGIASSEGKGWIHTGGVRNCYKITFQYTNSK